MTDEIKADEPTALWQYARDLDERMRALESRVEFVCDNLKAMADSMKARLDKTRQRCFIEQAAVRLLPVIYGHMTHNSEYDRQTMAKSALDRAFALWEETEARFEPEKDDTDG